VKVELELRGERNDGAERGDLEPLAVVKLGVAKKRR